MKKFLRRLLGIEYVSTRDIAEQAVFKALKRIHRKVQRDFIENHERYLVEDSLHAKRELNLTMRIDEWFMDLLNKEMGIDLTTKEGQE